MYFSSSPQLSDPYTYHPPEENTNLFQTTTDQNLDISNEKEMFILLDYFYNIFKIKKIILMEKIL